MKNQNKKGFTLVELVIVIAVIAILAGVLIGTFATVISRANQSKAVQEWKAAVDEAYVEYVAEYHDVPTTFKVDEGKTIVFGNEKTYADDRFLTGFQKLDTSGYIVLDDEQDVYFNWTANAKESTYAVTTTAEGEELVTSATVTPYVKYVVDNAFVNGAKFYKLGTGSVFSIEFSKTDKTNYVAVTTAISPVSYNDKTWAITFTLNSENAATACSVTEVTE